jgi:hypothetical protein
VTDERVELECFFINVTASLNLPLHTLENVHESASCIAVEKSRLR